MRRSIILSASLTVVLFTSACNTPPVDGTNDATNDAIEAPSPASAFSPFFVGGAVVGESLAAGAAVTLPGAGTLVVPQSSPDGIDVGVSQGSLTPEADEAFKEDFPDITLSLDILQISIRPSGQAPQYLILRLPVSDPASRIFFAGYIDEDTSNLAWEPVATQFDADTGMVTALIGWEQLGPVEVASDAVQKGLAALSGASPTVYTGHVAIGVGGQAIQGEVMFFADEPTAALTVQLGGAPIPVRARIGLSLSNITHQPLDSLTVTSDFGPRSRPVQGASTNHKGVDYRAVEGSNVYAAGDGVVITSRCANESVDCGRKANGDISGGYIVEIQHANGEVTRYLHLTNPAIVPVGVTVDAGQLIAFSGRTGGVAAHLHFEVRKDGVAVDPELIFNQQASATIAMAVDNQIEFGTAQQIPITRGIITPSAMASYVNVVELTDVDPGSHKLQFVLVQPGGQLRILAEVPLTVVGGGDFVGSEENVSDVTWTPSSGLVDYQYTRFTSTFSLVAVDDKNAEGQAHLTFENRTRTEYSSGDCPIHTSDSGLVEWDVPVTGYFETQPDGTLYLAVSATITTGPPILITYASPGCTAPFASGDAGYIWTGVGAHLTDGRFDLHQDHTLGTDESGQHFYEVHMRRTNGSNGE